MSRLLPRSTATWTNCAPWWWHRTQICPNSRSSRGKSRASSPKWISACACAGKAMKTPGSSYFQPTWAWKTCRQCGNTPSNSSPTPPRKWTKTKPKFASRCCCRVWAFRPSAQSAFWRFTCTCARPTRCRRRTNGSKLLWKPNVRAWKSWYVPAPSHSLNWRAICNRCGRMSADTLRASCTTNWVPCSPPPS